MLATAHTFAEQVSVMSYVVDIFYIVPSAAAMLIIPALALMDAGMVDAKHLVDTFAQKLVSALVSGGACMIAGYGIWNWQFYQALGVPHALRQSITDWSLLGPFMKTYAQNIDPGSLPGADSQQILVVFFFAYAVVVGAFIHSIGVGRMRPSACYVLSALAGGLVMPALAYLTWGPVGPLTNIGLHDFVGSYSLYMFIGTWSLIISWRLGPRLAGTSAFNGLLFGTGALLLMIAIPLFVIGCGVIQPGTGYFGASNVSSGLGIVFIDVFMAFTGGSISGAVIAYRKRNPSYIFLGPLGGYVICTALFDIAAPWQCLALGLLAPFLMLLGAVVVGWLKIDDQKIAPLALGPSIVSALVAGIIGSGLPTGGMPGGTGGYALQHAHMSLQLQLVGVLVTLAISGCSALVLVYGVEKVLGLRVSASTEQDGFDKSFWNA